MLMLMPVFMTVMSVLLLEVASTRMHGKSQLDGKGQIQGRKKCKGFKFLQIWSHNLDCAPLGTVELMKKIILPFHMMSVQFFYTLSSGVNGEKFKQMQIYNLVK